MIDHSIENIRKHIKQHSERSDDDRSAISTLGSFLRSKGRINTKFASDDKWPNHDGTFEFVSNPDVSKRPEQTFYVQIKGTTIYDETDDTMKYDLKDLAFPAFICTEVTFDPGILFVVLNPGVRGKERVFWKYMSVDFLNSIDFSHVGKRISFSAEDEILNDDNSVLVFCEQLKEIVEHHSFVNQLRRNTYTEDEVRRIVASCNKEITESIDRLDILNETRDNVSQRILTRLHDLCESALLLNAMRVGYTHPSIALAWEHSLLSIDTKFLGNFYRGLQYIARRIPAEGQSERLMLKYYNYMWQIRQSLLKHYNISILENLEKFHEYTGADELDQEFFRLIAESFHTENNSAITKSTTRFYVLKKTPFYIGKERYFELTLQQAGKFASKYNRITAYTKLDIETSYSVRIDYVLSSIELFGIVTEIKIVTAWQVSIDPRCMNKLGRILNTPISFSSKYGEYASLMRFLSETGMNLLEIIDLREDLFSVLVEQIYHECNTSWFRFILQKLRDDYSSESKLFGRYTVRYLLLNLREEILDRVMPSKFSKPLDCKDLYLSSKCVPFEQNPLLSNLPGSRTNTLAQTTVLASIVEKEKLDAAYPYLLIRNRMQETGEVYHEIDSELTVASIDSFNSQLSGWEKKAGHHISLSGNVACIDSYEYSTLFILKKLIELSCIPNKGQKEFNEMYLKNAGIAFTDPDKERTLRNAFVDSRVLLIYGAAGTGKTTLINMISSMMSGRKKLFLTKTHTALQNLKRRIENPGSSADFTSFDSFTKKVNLTEYDIVFIDECSIIDNRAMQRFFEKIRQDTFLVLAGDIYQIESIEFGNWFMYAKELIKTCGSNIELVSTWRTKDASLKNLWNEVRSKGDYNLITEKLVIDGPFSENIGEGLFNNKYNDEVLLCLNYDGKFGLNNMNNYFQNANSKQAVYWGDWKFKVGDPVLFNSTDRFSLLYNNLKGRIAYIEKTEGAIFFTIDVEIMLTENDCKKDGLVFVDAIDGGTRIRFDVISVDDELGENDYEKTIIPFQLAYAVSIHKAQGLEYKSVKVVIPSSNAEKISHGVFYTAITRATERLKIFWSKKTMDDVIQSFSHDSISGRSLQIINEKLKSMR